MSPNGEGGNIPAGRPFIRKEGPSGQHLFVSEAVTVCGTPVDVRFFRRTEEGDVARSAAPGCAKPKATSTGLAEGKTLPCDTEQT